MWLICIQIFSGGDQKENRIFFLSFFLDTPIEGSSAFYDLVIEIFSILSLSDCTDFDLLKIKRVFV